MHKFRFAFFLATTLPLFAPFARGENDVSAFIKLCTEKARVAECYGHTAAIDQRARKTKDPEDIGQTLNFALRACVLGSRKGCEIQQYWGSMLKAGADLELAKMSQKR